MEMIKFLDPPEEKEHEWKPVYTEVAPPFPQVLSGTWNYVSNPCTMTPKQLREHASRLL